MRLRVGATELVLLTAGLLGLLEQELVRVVLRIEPSTVISGICFVFVLIGAGVTVGKNFRIGPVEVALREREDRETKALKVAQKERRQENGGSG